MFCVTDEKNDPYHLVGIPEALVTNAALEEYVAEAAVVADAEIVADVADPASVAYATADGEGPGIPCGPGLDTII